MRSARVRWAAVGAAVLSGALLGWTISRGCGRWRCIEGPLDESQSLLFAILGAGFGLTVAFVLIRVEVIGARVRRLSERADLVVVRADPGTRDLVHARARYVTPADMFLRIGDEGLRLTTPEPDGTARDLTTLRWEDIGLVGAEGSQLRLLVGEHAWSFTLLDDAMGSDRVLGPREAAAVAARVRRAQP